MFMYLKLIYVEIIVRALSHYNTKNPAHLKEIIIIVGIRISFIAIIDIEQHAQLHIRMMFWFCSISTSKISHKLLINLQ